MHLVVAMAAPCLQNLAGGWWHASASRVNQIVNAQWFVMSKNSRFN